jgi:hypothetical protein
MNDMGCDSVNCTELWLLFPELQSFIVNGQSLGCFAGILYQGIFSVL